MTVAIRRADERDLELLTQWRTEVLREVFSIPENGSIEELERANRAYYLDALPAGRHIACFAVLNGKIVGCGGVCLYREMPSPDNPGGECAYLMNIYTRPAFRGGGIGGKIVQWLVDCAREKGVAKIYLESSPNARAFYRRMGFTDMHGYMMLGSER